MSLIKRERSLRTGCPKGLITEGTLKPTCNRKRYFKEPGDGHQMSIGFGLVDRPVDLEAVLNHGGNVAVKESLLNFPIFVVVDQLKVVVV